MKRIVYLLMMLNLFVMTVNAQDEDPGEKGFKKENLFTGGSVTVSFFNGQTILGANPMFGYKIANWVDAGLVFNYVYSSRRDYYEYNDKLRQTTFGPGVFTRLYPISFLFVQGQFERNFSTLKYTPTPGSTNYQTYSDKVGANSLLLGGGFASGRQPGSNSFFYISLLFDVLKDVNSPYVKVAYDPSNPASYRVDMVPILRAGVNIGLFQNRYR
jgi:hypothetical protein